MSALIASCMAMECAVSVSSISAAAPKFFSEKSYFMSAPFKGIGRRKETPLSSERGRAPNKRLITGNSRMKACQQGGVGVNEIRHDRNGRFFVQL